MAKKKVIDIEVHALFRTLERGSEFGLDYYDTKDRAFSTVRSGKFANRKHLSRRYNTYYRYFGDNVSFYVVCKVTEFDDCTQFLIKTIIIEKGRE